MNHPCELYQDGEDEGFPRHRCACGGFVRLGELSAVWPAYAEHRAEVKAADAGR